MNRKILSALLFTIALLTVPAFALAQTATVCPAFVPASQWDGIAGEPVGGQLNEIATIVAGTIYSVDGVNCLTAAGPTVVSTMTIPTLFVLRTPVQQTIPFSYQRADGNTYTDYVWVPPVLFTLPAGFEGVTRIAAGLGSLCESFFPAWVCQMARSADGSYEAQKWP
jgi:hypothetical protein